MSFSSATGDVNIKLNAVDNVTDVMKNVGASAKNLVTGFSALATSAFSLYMGFENIEKSGIALDRANLMVTRSTESLDQAQKNVNAAIAKYGPGSAEAKDAVDKLAIAQDALTLANERAGMAQQNVNNASIQMALMVVPTAITALTGMQKVITNVGDTLDWLQAHPMILAITAIVAIAAALVLAYEKCQWFHDGVDAVGSAIYDFFVPSTEKAKKSVKELTSALEAGVGYNAQFAEAQRQATIIADGFRAAQAKAAKETADFTETLKTSWDKQKAAADTSLGSIKTAFDSAFNAGNFNKAIGIVQDFAGKYGLSLKDAEKIIDDFAEKIKVIPKTIEEQLVGKAQADLQTFKDCSTGKFADISVDSTAAMQNLVSDTNDLIAHGLVGQAQDNIQAFVTCATDKQAKMVSDIDAQLKIMYNNYDQNTAKIKQLLEWRLALTFTGQPGSDILAAINIASGRPATTAEAALTGAAARGIAMQDRLELFLERMGMAEGGIVTRPTLIMAGEAGPEAIIPLNRGGGGFGAGITVQLIVEGGLDRKTADYAVERMKDMLQNVLVEPSSPNASATHKRIRLGSPQ